MTEQSPIPDVGERWSWRRRKTDEDSVPKGFEPPFHTQTPESEAGGDCSGNG